VKPYGSEHLTPIEISEQQEIAEYNNKHIAERQ
jgi:hypothetical protein